MKKEAVLGELAVFISRQVLVRQAIHELRPDLLALAASTDKNEMIEIFQSEKYRSVPSMGIWSHPEEGEWDYFIHGAGCRLINTSTREPIEWDAPNLDTFHGEWFMNWLKWHIRYVQQTAGVTDEVLRDIFDDLVNDGSIKEVKTKSGIEYRLND